MNRRGFMGSILALGAAPAIVRADSLMRVVPRSLTFAVAQMPLDMEVYGDNELLIRSGEIGVVEDVRYIESAGQRGVWVEGALGGYAYSKQLTETLHRAFAKHYSNPPAPFSELFIAKPAGETFIWKP